MGLSRTDSLKGFGWNGQHGFGLIYLGMCVNNAVSLVSGPLLFSIEAFAESTVNCDLVRNTVDSTQATFSSYPVSLTKLYAN